MARKTPITPKMDRSIPMLMTVIAVTALVVRLGHLAGASGYPAFFTPIVDSGEYHRIASDYAAGKGMGLEFFWQVFLYPFLLSLLYGVTGPSVVAAKIVQALLGTVTCVLVFSLGRRLFDRRIGLTAGLITALYGPLVFFEGEILATGLAAFFAVLLMLLLLRTPEDRGPLHFAATGAVMALATLTRATFLPFVGVASVWIVFALRRRGAAPGRIAGRLGLLLAGFALVAGSVAYKNRAVTGRFSFLPETGSLNLYMGNNPETDDIMALRPGSDWNNLLNRAKREGATTRDEARAYYRDLFLDYMTGRPLDFLYRMGRKAVQLTSSREIPSNLDPYDVARHSPVLRVLLFRIGGFGFPFGLLLPLALLGIFRFRRALPAPLVLFLIVYGGAILLVFVTGRYRAPMIPILAVPAALGLLHLVDRIRDRAPAPAAVEAGLMILLGVAISLPGPFAAERVDYAGELRYCLGVEAHRNGDDEEARKQLLEALRIRNDYGDAQGLLGIIAADQNRREEALERLTAAVTIDPDLESAQHALGVLLFDLDRIEESLAPFAEVVRINPRSLEGHSSMGRALGRLNRPEEALKHFEKALEIRPDEASVHLDMALALIQAGRLEEARKAVDRAHREALRRGDQATLRRIGALIQSMKKR